MAARPAGTAASRVRHEVRVRWLNALGSQAQPVQTGQLAPLFRDGAALCQLVQRLEPEAVLRYHRTVRSSKVAIGNIEQALNVVRMKLGKTSVPTAEALYFGDESTAEALLAHLWEAFAVRPLRAKRAALFRWAAAATRPHGVQLSRAATRAPFARRAAGL